MYWDNSKSFMKIVSMAYKNLGEKSDLSVAWNFDRKLYAPNNRNAITNSTDMRGVTSVAKAPVSEAPSESDAAQSDNKSQDPRKPLPK
jgi:hypothetical protein